jgi:hypothetical protein
VLTDLAKADKIPSPVIEFALQAGLDSRDMGIASQAAALRPKLFSLDEEGAKAVDQLLARVSSK